MATQFPQLTNPSLDKIKEYMHYSSEIQKNDPDSELAQHFKDANYALMYIYLTEYNNIEKQSSKKTKTNVLERDAPKETTNDDILRAISESRIRLTKQNAKLKEYIEEMNVKIVLLTQEVQSLKSNI